MDCICKKCGHEWYTDLVRPKQCPNCKSTTWDKPRLATKKPYTCIKCRITWTPRVDNPKQCPSCKSMSWNKGETL